MTLYGRRRVDVFSLSVIFLLCGASSGSASPVVPENEEAAPQLAPAKSRFAYATYGCTLLCDTVQDTSQDCIDCCVKCCETQDTTCSVFGWTAVTGCLFPVTARAVYGNRNGETGVIRLCDDVERCPTESDQPEPYLENDMENSPSLNAQGEYEINIVDGPSILETPLYGICNYPPRVEWIWKFRAESGAKLHIRIINMDVEDRNTCNRDFVRINNKVDNNSGVITRCGVLVDRAWTSRGRTIRIKFVSNDNPIRGDGFKIRITAF